MNEATRIVKTYLDLEAFHNYEHSLDKFKAQITKDISDCSHLCQEDLILLALKDVDWDTLWRMEYQRYLKATEEAERNRKEQEGLGDIPF